jgi:superfamily II DNA or RNA helicase
VVDETAAHRETLKFYKQEKAMQLREYQERAISMVRDSYRRGNKSILVVSPTGSGKGVILSSIINKAVEAGSNVMFLVHRREILFQVSGSLTDLGVDHGVILSGEDYIGGHQVNVATVQTLRSRMKNRNYQKADVIIVDESHHATSKTYLEVIDAHRENMILGFTATPCRKSGLGLGFLFDDLVNVETITNLTDLGFLVPVRYYAPSAPDLEKIKVTAGEYNLKSSSEAMQEPKLIGDVVDNWLKLAEGRQTMVFTTTVAHSVAICEAFNAVGIVSEHVSGKTPKDERAGIIYRFRSGDTRIICNCAVFTEGVDIPDISCVVMARPTKSLSLYMQCVGRGMRPAPGKEDMIFIDHAGCVYEHGAVHEITDWTLDEGTVNTNEVNEKRKKKNSKPISCPMCGLVYSGQLRCPSCRHTPEVREFGEDVEFIDADLGEVVFKGNEVEVKTVKKSNADKKLWHSQLTHYAKTKGFKAGWVWHKMKQKFGTCPRTVGELIPPSPEVINWIRSQNIRHAKSRGH